MRKHIRLIWNHRKTPKILCESRAMLACDAKNSACLLRSSDVKCLRFGLPLRFGLRCERPRCQIASDMGRAMWTTKRSTVSLYFIIPKKRPIHKSLANHFMNPTRAPDLLWIWPQTIRARQRSGEGIVRRNGCPKECFWSLLCPLKVCPLKTPERCWKP